MKKRIGIISAGWNDEYQQNILYGITESSRQYDFDTFSFICNNIDQTLEIQNKCAYNIYNLLNAECMDGLILLINTIYYKETIQDILHHFEKAPIPVICIDYEYPGMMTVGTDNYTSARVMVEHLFEGDERKRFACITGIAFNPESEMRVNAFKDVVTERMGRYDEDYVFQGDFQTDGGQKAAEHWHNSVKEFPDAVFCCNDKMAFGFLETCLRLGYRIPEDVKIVSYDNSNMAITAKIPISSMQCPLTELGKKSVELINEVFEGKEPEPKVHVTGTPFFRLSSASSKNDDKETANTSEKPTARSSNDITSQFLSNLMIEHFCSCNSIDDFMYRLENIVRRIPCDEFYLCFTKEHMLSMGNTFEVEEGEHFGYMLEGYSSHMYMLVHYEDKEFHKPQIFETKKILPVFDCPKDKHVDYIIFPLYYLEKTHGYCVIGNCNEVAYTGAFQTWTTMLSYSINTIYMRHELEQKAQNLEFLHERDSMTGVYNRLGFKKHSQTMVQKCIACNSQMIVLFADMDGMKGINDKFGHEEGDIAICTFSDILKENCIHGEILSRFGGDEMVIFGIHYTQDMADDFISRLEEKLDNYNAKHDLYELKASIGYQLYTPTSVADIEECVNKADEKMYHEKKLRKKRRATAGEVTTR